MNGINVKLNNISRIEANLNRKVTPINNGISTKLTTNEGPSEVDSRIENCNNETTKGNLGFTPKLDSLLMPLQSLPLYYLVPSQHESRDSELVFFPCH